MTFGQQYFLSFGTIMAAIWIIHALWTRRARRLRRNRYVRRPDSRDWSRLFMDSLR